MTLTSIPDGRVKLEFGEKNHDPFSRGLLQKEINCTPSTRGWHCSGRTDSRSMSGKYLISARTKGGKIQARNVQCRWANISIDKGNREEKNETGEEKLPRRTTAINNNLFDATRNVCASVMLSKCKTDRNKR